MNQSLEVWKDISGYEGLYQVSSFGKVRSLDRFVRGNRDNLRKQKGITLKPSLSNRGYHLVSLCKGGKSETCRVHRLVMQAFSEPVVGKDHINHKNGIKTDNRIENLEWCTPQENSVHAYRTLGMPAWNKGKRLVRLRECEWCGKTYNAITIKQRFCSTRCGAIHNGNRPKKTPLRQRDVYGKFT